VDGEWRLLEPGMCMTVEPGLYIATHAKGVAKRWRGVGIRIEDDVVVTKEGHEVMTGEVPKEPDAIEALIGQAWA
jgi:Xaa-Pro aminopeptidase